jgi:hypothetical protein
MTLILRKQHPQDRIEGRVRGQAAVDAAWREALSKF